MEAAIELGLFGEDEKALRGMAEQAERALRAYTSLSSLQRGSGGTPAAAALTVTPGAFTLGNTPVATAAVTPSAADKGLARGITGGMQAFGTIQNLATGSAFSSAAGAASTLASLKEPLEKLLPDSRLAQQFAMAAPAIPIALAGIGVAQRSYDSTMQANATEEQMSRRYGLGIYGQATYEYGLAARRRGVFSDTPATGALNSLENASRIVSSGGRAANLAAVNKALEASRSVGGGRSVSLSSGLGASIEAMASAAVMEGAAPVAPAAVQDGINGGDLLRQMQSAVGRESLRLGRELTTTERQHYYREALAESTQAMPQEAREKFFESIEKSEREEPFNPVSARAQYQQKMRSRRAAAYGRLGMDVPPSRNTLGTPDRNNRGDRGEEGVKGENEVLEDEDEPELTPQGARALRRAQGMQGASGLEGEPGQSRGNGIYSDEVPIDPAEKDTLQVTDYDKFRWGAGRRRSDGQKWSNYTPAERYEAVQKYRSTRRPYPKPFPSQMNRVEESPAVIFGECNVMSPQSVGKPGEMWTTQFGAGRGYKEPSGKKLED